MHIPPCHTIGPHEAEAIAAAIDTAELTELVLTLGNIPAPVGREGQAGQAVFDWMRKEGFAPRKVGLLAERFSVVGRSPGAGTGANLLFTAHLDTESPLYDASDAYTYRAETLADPAWLSVWLENGVFKGHAATNDRGPLACTLIAAKALKKAGITLGGTLYLSACPGEIGPEPAEEHQGGPWLGKELGALYMLTHGGVAPDYALIAEGTDFGVHATGCGYAYYRITLCGQQVFTPALRHPPLSRDHPNPIVRVAPLIEALQVFARGYEERHRHEGPGGTAIPRVQIGAIRGGHPATLGAGSEICRLYLEIILAPGQRIAALDRELKAHLQAAGFDRDIEVEPYVVRPGFTANESELAPLRAGLDRAHELTRGGPAPQAAPVFSSMWRDHNVFNMSGIPAAVLGPARWEPTPADFVSCARIYALTALAVCGRAS